MRALILGLALATACTGADTNPPPEAAPAGPTPALLEEARNSVGGMMPLDNARKTLEEKLGKPTADTDEELKWVARDGERCRVLTVQKVGTMVGQIALKTTRCPE